MAFDRTARENHNIVSCAIVSCTNLVTFVIMGEEIQVPISVGWFSILINNDSIILRETRRETQETSCEKLVQESDMVIIFSSSMVKEMCGSIECMSVLWKESTVFIFYDADA